jgi:hypothetical protein
VVPDVQHYLLLLLLADPEAAADFAEVGLVIGAAQQQEEGLELLLQRGGLGDRLAAPPPLPLALALRLLVVDLGLAPHSLTHKDIQQIRRQLPAFKPAPPPPAGSSQ